MSFTCLLKDSVSLEFYVDEDSKVWLEVKNVLLSSVVKCSLFLFKVFTCFLLILFVAFDCMFAHG